MRNPILMGKFKKWQPNHQPDLIDNLIDDPETGGHIINPSIPPVQRPSVCPSNIHTSITTSFIYAQPFMLASSKKPVWPVFSNTFWWHFMVWKWNPQNWFILGQRENDLTNHWTWGTTNHIRPPSKTPVQKLDALALCKNERHSSHSCFLWNLKLEHYLGVYIYMYICICTYIYIHIYVCIHIYIYTDIFMFMCIYIYTYTYIHTYIHTYIA